MRRLNRKHLKVLVIDDCDEDREVFQRLIQEDEEYEYKVFEVGSAEEGLEVMRTIRPDCIVLDFNLPDTDGLEFMERLKEQTGEKDQLPVVILVTGQGSESVAVQALKCGAQDYLVKSNITGPNLHRAIHNSIERNDLYFDLQKQCESLEHLNADLNQVIFIAAHDLKEPVRVIGAYVSLLEHRLALNASVEVKEYLSFLRLASKGLGRMIDGIQSCAETRRTDRHLEYISAKFPLSDALSNLRMAIKESGALVEIPEHLPLVFCDRSQIAIVFQNLIHNALKYCGRNSPEVKINVQETRGSWVFSVSDNGMGIEPENLSQVFLMFKRLHPDDCRQGAGIGLANCKFILERHGGNIWVESKPNHGSTFFFSIPMHQKEEPVYVA